MLLRAIEKITRKKRLSRMRIKQWRKNRRKPERDDNLLQRGWIMKARKKKERRIAREKVNEI